MHYRKKYMDGMWFIILASLGTALACGLGALPFIWVKKIDKKWIGYANALASAMMIAASFDLIYQGLDIHTGSMKQSFMVVGGVLLGLLFVVISDRITERYERKQNIHHDNPLHMKKGWKTALLMLVIMTLHSGAEGIAMGVAQGAGETIGLFVIIVMALQNIPEGLAISLQMVPNGTPWWKAALRSIASSLPQPIFAPLAFYFVEVFAGLVPWGLGFAAGCMLWMCFGEITADSYEGTDRNVVGIIATLSIVFMIVLQILVG